MLLSMVEMNRLNRKSNSKAGSCNPPLRDILNIIQVTFVLHLKIKSHLIKRVICLIPRDIHTRQWKKEIVRREMTKFEKERLIDDIYTG